MTATAANFLPIFCIQDKQQGLAGEANGRDRGLLKGNHLDGL
jgi:hypothetical protein